MHRAGAVVAKYSDKSVYFDLEDLCNTTGQWDVYGSDAPCFTLQPPPGVRPIASLNLLVIYPISEAKIGAQIRFWAQTGGLMEGSEFVDQI
ncbi:putative photosystem I PsaH, reaction centre subunit VI [Helianthus anomalus]